MKIVCSNCGYTGEIDGRTWSPYRYCPICSVAKLSRVDSAKGQEVEIKKPIKKAQPVPTGDGHICDTCHQKLFKLHNFNERHHLFICLTADCRRYRQPQGIELRGNGVIALQPYLETEGG